VAGGFIQQKGVAGIGSGQWQNSLKIEMDSSIQVEEVPYSRRYQMTVA